MTMLPTVDLCGQRVTRLICGGNPLSGYSHVSGELDREMIEYYDMPHIQALLANLSEALGPVGVFVHLHPRTQDNPDATGLFPEAEEARVKQVFFLAKHLKDTLVQAAAVGRSCFLTVTRMDGQLGLGGKTDFSPLSGGLFGLTKTLNLEWEPVFCRAVDLHPDIPPKQAARHILAELHDPDLRVVEVGYTPEGRFTLTVE